MLTVTLTPTTLIISFMFILVIVIALLLNRKEPKNLSGTAIVPWKVRQWHQYHKENYLLYFGRLVFLCGLIWLLIANRSILLMTTTISSWQDAKTLLLTTQNISFLFALAVYSAASLAYFLFMLPFLKLEQLKIFGVEYKVATEQEKIVEKAYNARNELELFRVTFLEGIADLDPSDPDGVLQCIGSMGQLKVWDLAERLADTLENSYEAKFESQVSVFVTNVKNGQLLEGSLRMLPPEVQYAFRKVWATGAVFPVDGTEDAESYNYSMKAVPLKLDDADSTYSILCLHSFTQKFWEVDEYMISNAWKSLLSQATIATLASRVEGMSG